MLRILYLLLAAVAFITGCGESQKKTSPEDLVRDFVQSIQKKDFKHAYRLVSHTGNEDLTEEGFTSYNEQNSTNWAGFDSLTEINLPQSKSFRHFEVPIRYTDKESQDELVNYEYFTLILDKGEWKIIWTKILEYNMLTQEYNGETVKASETASSILKINPGCYKCASVISSFSGETGEAKKKLVFAEQAASLAPREPIILHELASIYSKQGDFKKSAPLFWRAIQYIKEPEGRLLTCSLLAMDYIDADNFDSAGICVKSALEIDPNDFAMKTMDCEVMIGKNEAEKGLETSRQLLSVTPGKENKEVIYERIGICLYKESKKTDRYPIEKRVKLALLAKEYLENASKVLPNLDADHYLILLASHLKSLRSEGSGH